ncbi:MAG: class I SAM-dependent methyltransferase [Deltaproteobacteria bacterium]|nr:class I SAM-dependent methyltransferase [Deltaproteobacteria bacterium]
MKIDKYHFYEESVQSPEEDIELFIRLYKQARHREPRRLREDFCGTFKLACEFVKLDRRNTAEGLDLDPEPLAYGRRRHFSRLTLDQKSRLDILQRNVISVSRQKTDLIVANNFSFFIFRERKTLVDYFKACRRSLRRGGVLVLEMVGGPGFVEKTREQRTIKMMGKAKFKYIWDQRSFNPINREGHYSIHFKLPNGRQAKHAFSYHWRIWTIPEVRDALREAGFKDTCAYWETSHRGVATGEFIRTEKGDNDWTWLAYIGGMK